MLTGMLRHTRRATHTFEVDSHEWNGMCIHAAVEVSAKISGRYTEVDGDTREVAIDTELLTHFDIIDADGNSLDAAAVALIRDAYEPEIIEAVKDHFGDVDIEFALLERYADAA